MIRALAVLAVAAVLGAIAAGAPAGALGASKATYYVSLGDSLAQGYQPVGGPNSPLGFPGYNQGYADQLFKAIRGSNEQLQLVKLGCGGETTRTMVLGAVWCGFPEGSQLAQALAFLTAHHGEVALITIDVGANDVFQYGEQAPGIILTYLPQILASLRAAAGPDVPIVGMNYYGVGLPEVWFGTHSLAAVQAYIAAVQGFNDLLEAIYAAAGSPVADVEGAFQVTDTTLVDGTPLDVLRECQWTWICAPPPLGPDIHANSDGYGVIAQAFVAALP